MSIDRKGDVSKLRTMRTADRCAVPWSEDSHCGSCEKPDEETDYVRNLRRELARRRTGERVRHDLAKESYCAACGDTAMDGQLLCDMCDEKRMRGGKTCSVPGCGRPRKPLLVQGVAVRTYPYCPEHFRQYQRRSARFRYERRREAKGD